MTCNDFTTLCNKGVILLDGATGSQLRAKGMPVGVNSDYWAWEHPEIITALKRAYVDAGSDIIYAPTFSANRMALEMHGLEDKLELLNTDMVKLARQAADGRALVAGDFATCGKPLEPIGTLTYQALFDVYKEQVEVVNAAGVDLLVAETMLSVDECACFVEAARSVCQLPVMVSLTMEADGHLLFGGSAVEAVETLQALGVSAVGLNCSVGPDQLESVVASMKAVATVPVIAKPNAGLPVMDDKGQAHYSMTPDQFAASMAKLVKAGASIIGGCCGTGPEYIAALRKVVGKY